MKKILPVILLTVFLLPTISWGQTNPTAQTLPYGFTSQTGGTLPNGMAVHRFGTTSGSIPTTRTTSEANGDLPYNSTANSGGWKDFGNDGIGLLASSSQAAGALVVAVNTTGLSNVSVSWMCSTQLQQASRDNSIALQYRVGTTGTFTDAGSSSTYTSQSKTAVDYSTTYTETLPSQANNQAVVQIRWIFWESNGSTGSRDRIAVDEINITGQPSNPVTGVTLTSTGATTATISWTAPTNYNSTNNEIIVFLKRSATITEGIPSTAIGNYSSNAAFGVGSQYENDAAAYCMYKGDGTSVNVTNLLEGNTYTALIYNTNNASSYSTSATNTAVLPVELTSFKAIASNNNVHLNWATATEVNNYGFNVERRITNGDGRPETGDWTKVGFVNGHGNSNSPKQYSYLDKNVPAGNLQYRLKQIDFDGAFEYSNAVDVTMDIPLQASLAQNYPNPFNPETVINYQVASANFVSLKVYDVLGKEVAILVNEFKQAGSYNSSFSIQNLPAGRQGSKLSSGVYYYQLRAGNVTQTKKMIIMK